MDRLLHKYCDDERIDSYVKGQTEFADKDDKESAYLIAEWTREAFHTAAHRVITNLEYVNVINESDALEPFHVEWLVWLDALEKLSNNSDVGRLLSKRLDKQLHELRSNKKSSKTITL